MQAIDLFQAKAGWCGKEDKYVYCVTHMDTLHMWDAMEVRGHTVMFIILTHLLLFPATSFHYLIYFISLTHDLLLLPTSFHYLV